MAQPPQLPTKKRYIKRARHTAVAIGIALLTWAVGAVFVFGILPSATPSGKAAAVVVLAGAEAERWPVAVRLVNDNFSPVLLFSTVDDQGERRRVRPCQIAGTVGMDTRCFSPAPVNTRGEAVSVAEAIELGDFDSVIVVTSRYHAARTHLLLSQCTSARIEVVVSEPALTPFGWISVAVVETGGLLDALLHPECTL